VTLGRARRDLVFQKASATTLGVSTQTSKKLSGSDTDLVPDNDGKHHPSDGRPILSD
jgi:hypothetical protein